MIFCPGGTGATPSKPVSPPQCPLLERRDEIVGEARAEPRHGALLSGTSEKTGEPGSSMSINRRTGCPQRVAFALLNPARPRSEDRENGHHRMRARCPPCAKRPHLRTTSSDLRAVRRVLRARRGLITAWAVRWCLEASAYSKAYHRSPRMSAGRRVPRSPAHHIPPARLPWREPPCDPKAMFSRRISQA